jgi:WXG100 family type VII secretion target
MFEGGGGGTAQVDTALLTEAANEAGTTADGLDTMLRNLMTNLSPLIEAWKGQGGTAFQGVQEQFDEEMRALNSALRSVGDSMGVSSTNYVNADDEMVSDLRSVGATTSQITRLLEG